MSAHSNELMTEKIEAQLLRPKSTVQLPFGANKRNRENSTSNANIGRFIYPIANCSFNSKSSVNLLYRMKYPEKPHDTSKLINFVSNKGLRHSYSSSHFFGFNEDTSENITSLNNTMASSKHFIPQNSRPAQPYSNAEREYYQNNLKNEMRHRSLMIGRLPPIRKKVFHQINESEREEVNNDQYASQEKSNMRIRKRYQRMIPQIKVMEKNIQKWNAHNKLNRPSIGKSDKNNQTIQIRHIDPNTRFLRKRDASNIKMTASYVRDLKIIAAFNKMQDPMLMTELKRKIVGESSLFNLKDGL